VQGSGHCCQALATQVISAIDKLMPKVTSLAFAIWCLSHAAAFAWGAEGHHLVARIAADELTPRAKAAVADLLGGDATAGMIRASTWADEIRPSRPETAPWHYVNIEITSTGYDAARDCPNDACVVAQVERDAKIVWDSAISKPVRADALRFLIHFVGDMHQPLHCSDNQDHGGSSVRVVFEGHRTNLHAI
jgi:nuclease S1